MHGIAKRVGLDDDQVERFVRESPWEYAAVQAHLNTHVPQEIESPDAALILDDVALVKKGNMSVAAYRQYCGATGKTDECQVAVDLVYAAPNPDHNADQKTWPLGMQLYVPRGWLEDPAFERARDGAQLPNNVTFRTKHEIALDLIDRARHLPHASIGGDAGYGDNAQLRKQLRDRKEPYVLGVTPSQLRVIPADTPIQPPPKGPSGHNPRTHPIHSANVQRESPRMIAARAKNWTRIDWSEGTKETLNGLFCRTQVRVVEGHKVNRWVTDEVAWLLLEKRSNELKAYLCWGFDNATLQELVAAAHLRWTIEQFHREAKQMLGLDQFEGRTWKGWHHHVTMVLLAYAYLALHRARTKSRPIRPTLQATADAIVLEVATQRLIRKHRLKRPHAKRVATTMLLEFTEWDG